MKRQLVSTAVLLSICFVLLPAQKPKGMKPGVERWPIKTSAHHMNETPKDVDFAKLIALPDPAGVKKNDARYQDAFIPTFQNTLNLREGDMVRISGWLHLVAYETDGDFHIQISSSGTDGNNCLIVEVPYPTYVKSAPNLKKLCNTVRIYVKANMLKGKDPGSATVLSKAVYVTVTGQLFYDDSHVGDPPRGKKGMHAATLWEVHPVTDVQIAQPQGH